MAGLTTKCPVCKSCMAKLWILPNRYYYCDFCDEYYGGRDDALQLQDKELIHSMQKDASEKNK